MHCRNGIIAIVASIFTLDLISYKVNWSPKKVKLVP